MFATSADRSIIVEISGFLPQRAAGGEREARCRRRRRRRSRIQCIALTLCFFSRTTRKPNQIEIESKTFGQKSENETNKNLRVDVALLGLVVGNFNRRRRACFPIETRHQKTDKARHKTKIVPKQNRFDGQLAQ